MKKLYKVVLTLPLYLMPRPLLNLTTDKFVPDIYITHKSVEDKKLLEEIKPLFFEHSPKEAFLERLTRRLSKKISFSGKNRSFAIREKAKKEFGAQELYLPSEDKYLISSLYFKRENAPLNIIYVTGYFEQETPLKEWGAPFGVLFPEFNILTFDWRGYGNSSGSKKHFGSNAYKDILTTIDFMRSENDKPIILVGFCMGGALSLYATIKAKEEKRNGPDAIVLNCPFTDFLNIMPRVAREPGLTPLQWLALNSKAIFDLKLKQLNGNLLNLNPKKMVEKIDIPCYIEHSTADKMVPIEEGIKIFKSIKTPQKMFMKSEIGQHVRIHTSVPYQYRNAFLTFLKKFDFL
ncbi:alpha/beta fold hydrolase [Candidatus Babeliales bacterium]|nr:alpha/beta fold hydrolase [Candidatus Babeliales bacterium]